MFKICVNPVVAPTELHNAALSNKATEQSSLSPPGVAMRAIDGKMDVAWWLNSCSYTNIEDDPWWRVDLSHLYTVWHVTVTNFRQRK